MPLRVGSEVQGLSRLRVGSHLVRCTVGHAAPTREVVTSFPGWQPYPRAFVRVSKRHWRGWCAVTCRSCSFG